MTEESHDNTEDRSAVLFPHTYLPEAAWKTIFSYFQSITLCEPWYAKGSALQEEIHGRINVIHPPSSLRPPADFMKLLSEYREWVAQNRGAAPLLQGSAGEGSTWDIRKAIRQAEKKADQSTEEKAFLWHLLLHLEQDLERGRTSTDEMILMMKSSASPLREALGEAEPGQGLLDDLPVSSSSSPPVEERHLRQLLNAWFGLFGAAIPQDHNFLTLSPEVLSYAAELFGTALPHPGPDHHGSRFKRVELPRADASIEEDPVLHGLSGRTLIYVNCD